MTDLTRNQLDWLSSLARQQIRKRERRIAQFAPKPGQPEAEALEFLEKVTRDLEFARDTLRAVDRARASRGGPIS